MHVSPSLGVTQYGCLDECRPVVCPGVFVTYRLPDNPQPPLIAADCLPAYPSATSPSALSSLRPRLHHLAAGFLYTHYNYMQVVHSHIPATLGRLDPAA